MKITEKVFAVVLLLALTNSISAQPNIITLKSLNINGINVSEIIEYEAKVEDKFNNLVVGPKSQIKKVSFDRFGNALYIEDSMRKSMYIYEGKLLKDAKTEYLDPMFASMSTIEKYQYTDGAIKISLFSIDNTMTGLKSITLNKDGTYQEQKVYDSTGSLKNYIKYEYYNQNLISYKNYRANGNLSMSLIYEYDQYGNKIKAIEDTIYVKVETLYEYYENGLPKRITSFTSNKIEIYEYEYEFNKNMDISEKREYLIEEKFGQSFRTLNKVYSTEYAYYN